MASKFIPSDLPRNWWPTKGEDSRDVILSRLPGLGDKEFFSIILFNDDSEYLCSLVVKNEWDKYPCDPYSKELLRYSKPAPATNKSLNDYYWVNPRKNIGIITLGINDKQFMETKEIVSLLK